MKQAIVTIIVLTVLAYVWLFPKIEAQVEINLEKVKVPLYCVELEGAVEVSFKKCFLEEITIQEVFMAAENYMSSDANLSVFNFSEVITNHRTIYISREVTQEIVIHTQLDINKANFQQLMQVPGITETRAASIIIYRETHGKFTHLDELIHVKHIGTVTLEKIKPYLKIG